MSKDVVFNSDINDPQSLLNEFFAKHEYLTADEKTQITKAWSLLIQKAGKIERFGGLYYVHPLRVANILAENKLDCASIVSAILHSIHDFDVSPEQIKNDFGDDIFKIVTTTNKILNLPMNTKTLHQSDDIRNMLFAMCDDARIILITLADRLDRIRNIKSFSPEEQHVIAKSVIEIWGSTCRQAWNAGRKK